MRALHADALRQQADPATAQRELLGQVGLLELLARFPQREAEKVLLDQRLGTTGGGRELLLQFREADLFHAPGDEQAPYQVGQLAHIVRPGVVAQAVLGGEAEAAEGQAFLVHEAVHRVAQQLRHVLVPVAQRGHAQLEHGKARKQVLAHEAGTVRRQRGRYAQVERHRDGMP